MAWIVIGCFGMLFLEAIAIFFRSVFAFDRAKTVIEDVVQNPMVVAAKLIAGINPKIGLIETDGDRQTVTFRNTRAGGTFTVDYGDIKKGKVNFSSKDQSVSVDLEVEGWTREE